MAGGDPSSQSNRYTHNDAAFVEYNTRLQSNNLTTFTTAASRFTEWLGSDKAYYPNARVPILSIIESAHANICRVQGDPSVPFVLEKALPGLDPWYRPYLSLLRQAGSHLNHFEPELRARLQLLVENAGMKIVRVPTLTENTGTQPKLSPSERRDDDCVTPMVVGEKITSADALSQAAGPSNQVQQSGTSSPATMPEPQRKGRRKLNKAIFDVDTMAALRSKTQMGHRTLQVNDPPPPNVTTQQKATGMIHPSIRLPEGPPDSPLMDRAPNAENLTGEHLEFQTKDAYQSAPLPEVTVASSSGARSEGSLLLEPHERPSISLPGKEEPGDDATICNLDGRLGMFEAPAVNPLPEKVETSNVDEQPPAPPDARPEPMATESSADFPAPTPDLEVVGAGEREETPNRPQDVSGILEDMSRGARSPGKITARGTGLRRKSHDAVGEGQGRTSPEPPVKRIRTESEATTATNPSTPRPATRGLPDSTISVPKSLWVPHGIQRSNSDMILDSEDEAPSPPRPDKEAADKRAIHNDSFPLSEQQSLTVPRAETLAGVSHERQMPEETMPSIQGLSLASPEFKANPFTAFRTPLHSPGALPPFVSSTVSPNLGRLSFCPPVAGHTLNSNFTADPQATPQETSIQQTYIFSAAEIRTLVASRGSDEGSGPNKLVFYLDWGVVNRIVRWRNFKAGQGPLEGSFCLSLAGYPVDSVASLMSTAKGNQPFDVLIRQARIKSSWPSGPTFRSTLKDELGKSYIIPPFSTTEDNFVDISESAIPGTNTYRIEENGQSLSDWLFAVYVHTPTIAYFDAIQARVDKEKKWVDTLTSFTMYSLPAVNWDTLEPRNLG